MIDFDSEELQVLINPRTPDQERIKKKLLTSKLKNHFLIATSGTSSTAVKWVALSKKALLASAEAVNEHLEVTEKDVWGLALPHFHVGGLGILLRAKLSHSLVVCYQTHIGERWSPEKFHKMIIKHGVTLTALVPTQLFDLVKAKLKAPSSLRATVIGGAAMGESLYHEAKSLGWSPLPSFGCSECSSQIATASLCSLKEEVFPKLKLLAHIQKVELSENGCLMVQSPSLLTGYLTLSENGHQFVDPKVAGVFITEDLVEIAGDTLKPIGRKGDFVKIGGESVNVERLNKIWSELEYRQAVEGDQTLFVAPDERLGSVIHLAVAGTKEKEVRTLIEAYHKEVLPFERIRKIHNLPEIPRTPLGKVKKSRIILNNQGIVI